MADRVEAAGRAHPEWCLWRHALVPDPRPFPPPPAFEFSMHWQLRPRGGLLEGDVFGDGSVSSIVPGDPVVGSAGWGVVQIDPLGTVLCSMYGPMTGRMQESEIAEG
ncbi:unnamed protein product [Prorocentrum cordatum]|uniref:Uncharacterized protein n=1 Tax=Prorocentrum cordatum TaxID=2364126 RepID=A0ABN9XLB6_9DINO|nr:unnamed protein product [Polarella glacialis]